MAEGRLSPSRSSLFSPGCFDNAAGGGLIADSFAVEPALVSLSSSCSDPEVETAVAAVAVPALPYQRWEGPALDRCIFAVARYFLKRMNRSLVRTMRRLLYSAQGSREGTRCSSRLWRYSLYLLALSLSLFTNKCSFSLFPILLLAPPPHPYTRHLLLSHSMLPQPLLSLQQLFHVSHGGLPSFLIKYFGDLFPRPAAAAAAVDNLMKS